MAAWKAKNQEKVRAYGREWARKDAIANPGRVRPIANAYRANNREKYRAAYKKWLKKNPEKAVAATKAWRAKRPDWDRLYYAANADKIRARNRNSYQANPVPGRLKSRKYQGARRAAQPPWLTAIHLAQISEFYEVAVALETQTGIEHHVDHIHPLRGRNFRGLHVPWNLQVLPGAENRSKNNRLLPEG